MTQAFDPGPKRNSKPRPILSHHFPVAPNLLNQNFAVEAPGLVWVGDITYIHTDEGWMYLAALLDLGNREVVGWSASARMTRQLAIDALQMALGRQKPGKGRYHHSDRGSQYASADYQKILNEHGMICSMSRKGNCYDNAVAESFFGCSKPSGSTITGIKTESEAYRSLFYYIEIFYNRKRRHSTLGYATPQDYEIFLLAA